MWYRLGESQGILSLHPELILSGYRINEAVATGFFTRNSPLLGHSYLDVPVEERRKLLCYAVYRGLTSPGVYKSWFVRSSDCWHCIH